MVADKVFLRPRAVVTQAANDLFDLTVVQVDAGTKRLRLLMVGTIALPFWPVTPNGALPACVAACAATWLGACEVRSGAAWSTIYSMLSVHAGYCSRSSRRWHRVERLNLTI